MRAVLESVEGNRATLEIEVDVDAVEEALQRAYRKVVQRVQIPGFRKGKAPRRLVERHVGKGALWQEALDHLVPDAYRRAVEEIGIEPIDEPDIDIVRMEDGAPFAFKATVEVKPEVELGDYRSFRAERPEAVVTEEEVESALRAIQEKHAALVPVGEGEGAAEGNVLTVDFVGRVDGEPFEGGSAEDVAVELGAGRLLPGFEEQLLGARPGEEREVRVTFPEDYGVEQLNGREATFHVTVKEVKRKDLPPLDDELARAEGAETLEELRNSLSNRLRQRAEAAADAEWEGKVLDALIEGARVDLPEVLVHRRIHRLMDELRSEFQRQGFTLEQFLQQNGQSEEDLHTELRPRAEREVKLGLALEAVQRAEGIAVGDAEVEAEVDRMVAPYGDSAAQIKRLMLSGENARQIRDSLAMRRTVARLKEYALGKAPAAAESGSAPAAPMDETAAIGEG